MIGASMKSYLYLFCFYFWIIIELWIIRKSRRVWEKQQMLFFLFRYKYLRT
jgi:hypothetical protein